MKFEKIEERAALWTAYWEHVMEQKNYGLDDLNLWCELFKPALRQPEITFDQWLFEKLYFDLVDFRDWEPYNRFGRMQMFSTVENDPKKLIDIFQQSGYMFTDLSAEKPVVEYIARPNRGSFYIPEPDLILRATSFIGGIDPYDK